MEDPEETQSTFDDPPEDGREQTFTNDGREITGRVQNMIRTVTILRVKDYN